MIKTLYDLSEDDLRLVASFARPPDVAALALTSKQLFWSRATRTPQHEATSRDEPLGVALVQAAMRRHLERRLEDLRIPQRRHSTCETIRSLSVQDLFPDVGRGKLDPIVKAPDVNT